MDEAFDSVFNLYGIFQANALLDLAPDLSERQVRTLLDRYRSIFLDPLKRVVLSNLQDRLVDLGAPEPPPGLGRQPEPQAQSSPDTSAAERTDDTTDSRFDINVTIEAPARGGDLFRLLRSPEDGQIRVITEPANWWRTSAEREDVERKLVASYVDDPPIDSPMNGHSRCSNWARDV